MAGLKTRAELPHQVEGTKTAIAILITYKRIIGYSWKEGLDGKKRFSEDYGGAMASYPKELDFTLDTQQLLPEASQ